MTWLSFIELGKAVVHVIRLASCLWLWFQSVCPLVPSLSAYHLTCISLTLDVGYLLSATTPDLDSVIHVYLIWAVLIRSVVLFIDPESPESGQGIWCSFSAGLKVGVGIIQRFSLWLWENQRPNCQHPLDHQKSKRVPPKTSSSALLPMPKPLTVWITINCGKFWRRWEYQTTWPASWETCMQIRKQQLELDMEQQTGSK